MRSKKSAILVAALLSACSGIKPKIHVTPGDDVVRVRGIAIFPVAYRWDVPPYLAYERAMTLVNAVDAMHQLVVLGPTEFKIQDADSIDVLQKTNIAATLHNKGIAISEQLALRAWAEERVASQSEQLYDLQGNPLGTAHNDQITLVAHLEVLHPATYRVLLEMELTRELDPLIDRGTVDPLPELTEMLPALVKKAFDALEPRLDMPKSMRTAIDFKMAQSARPGFDMTTPNHPAYADTLAKMDVLDQLVAKTDRYHALDPAADDARVQFYDDHPPGLYVSEPGPVAKGAGLQAGDLILTVDGEPAVGAHVLTRRVLAGGPTLKLTVARTDGNAEIALPVK